MSESRTYVYRAVYLHNGRDAGLVAPGGCEAKTKAECYRLAQAQTRGHGTYTVRRYRVVKVKER